MTIPEFQFKIRAAVKAVIGSPEGQQLIREVAKIGKIEAFVKAMQDGQDEAIREVCNSMNRPVGSPQNPRW